ncbi:MAG: hypothetical protein ACJAVA_002519 [Flavobacteriaceae bacterium]|jgi:hypothetical protein
MKSLILTIILFAICLFFTGYSSGGFIIMAIPMLILFGVIATLFVSVWFDGKFWDKKINASKIAFPLTAVTYLIGYFYDTLKVML